MKALKITLIVTVFLATLTSCTKQDLGEDDVLQASESREVLFTGGQVQD